MISSSLLKLAARRKWIFLGALLWSIALAFVARGTARFREHQNHVFKSELEIASQDLDTDLDRVNNENHRLRKELQSLAELRASAANLTQEIASQQKSNETIWKAHSNLLSLAIDQEQRELAEINRWSSDWHATIQREAAQARWADKQKESSGDAEKDFAATKNTLSKLALARKRLFEIRNEWVKLDKTEKEKFRNLLEEAQAEWMTANEQLGKDEVLYRFYATTNSTQNPSNVLLMQSIIPDQNGRRINVFLDGTVILSGAENE